MNPQTSGRVGGLTCYATHGGDAMTKHLNGVEGGRMRFWLARVDPEGLLELDERMRRALALQRAHLIRAGEKAREKRAARR